LVIHDFGHPEKNEILYSAKRAEIEIDEQNEYLLIHPKDKTVLSLYEANNRKDLLISKYIHSNLPIEMDQKTDIKFQFYHKPELHILNETVREDFDYLQNLKPGDPPIVVIFSEEKSAQVPLRQIDMNDTAGEDDKLNEYIEMGMIPATPQSMVLHVHGGPHYRDKFGFSSTLAWLTNRGYAVLQVNYRGSTGFGKEYTNAGNGEWGRKMHNDLIDAVNFAVKYAIADPFKIAIMGGSYGGYAALVGMTFTPDVFACGVDSCGPSNLITFLGTIPPYWMGGYKELVTWLGADKVTPEGRAFLRSRSPLFFADRIKKPLIILQGANDPRVKQNESGTLVFEKSDIRISKKFFFPKNRR
uniref:Dipeptidyl peptidase family member 6 (inferred by orthology to a C. elegans protein) n=1 Tax=Anisakis simplex TaxID=6269 RepID=A0A0M3KDX1_ANISI